MDKPKTFEQLWREETRKEGFPTPFDGSTLRRDERRPTLTELTRGRPVHFKPRDQEGAATD